MNPSEWTLRYLRRSGETMHVRRQLRLAKTPNRCGDCEHACIPAGNSTGHCHLSRHVEQESPGCADFVRRIRRSLAEILEGLGL